MSLLTDFCESWGKDDFRRVHLWPCAELAAAYRNELHAKVADGEDLGRCRELVAGRQVPRWLLDELDATDESRDRLAFSSHLVLQLIEYADLIDSVLEAVDSHFCITESDQILALITIDHVMPKSRGGGDYLGSCAPGEYPKKQMLGDGW